VLNWVFFFFLDFSGVVLVILVVCGLEEGGGWRVRVWGFVLFFFCFFFFCGFFGCFFFWQLLKYFV